MLAAHLFRHFVRVGTLRVTDAHGRTHSFSGSPGPTVSIRLHDAALHRRLLLQPKLAFGEAYMEGTLTIEDGTLYRLLDRAGRAMPVCRTACVSICATIAKRPAATTASSRSACSSMSAPRTTGPSSGRRRACWPRMA